MVQLYLFRPSVSTFTEKKHRLTGSLRFFKTLYSVGGKRAGSAAYGDGIVLTLDHFGRADDHQTGGQLRRVIHHRVARLVGQHNGRTGTLRTAGDGESALRGTFGEGLGHHGGAGADKRAAGDDGGFVVVQTAVSPRVGPQTTV